MASHPQTSIDSSPYVPAERALDEMCTPRGEVRDHWRYLMQSIQALGSSQLDARVREVERLLRDDGATYNVYDTPGGLNRAWRLDPIPLLISSEEWAGIEAGLLERAELLNLVLEDLYGPRSLIHNGVLPASLIYAHRGFLRPCAGAGGPRRGLTLFGVDLARCSDGSIRVLNDRSQAPSGLGYALENRTVMSRVMPSLFRESHPHRLAYFFRALRSALAASAPPGREDPRVVLLTPGPRNEAYFEHVFLANYLGYTLVEGLDLTVRDGRVWIKSLGGLEPVDVILRRVDDDYCDPLELRPESKLGVAGLVEMVRRGVVSVANPLGSGVLENPALGAFLPQLAKHFLGHELRLPSVPTWWCGNAMDRDYVLTNLHRMVIRPIHRGTALKPTFGEWLGTEDKSVWRDRIRAHPHLYVGQERVDLSTAPTVGTGGVECRKTVLRAFLAARDDSFVVMPGGLTRVAPDTDTMAITNQAGAISKDTWVLASEPETAETNEPGPRPRGPGLAGYESLPGRVAESLFWMARYAERAEEAIRLVRTIHTRINETIQFDDPDEGESLRYLLRALTHLTATYPGFAGEGAEQRVADPEPEIIDLIMNRNRAGSVAGNLTALLQAAYSVRDLVSADTWRVINDIEDELAAMDRSGAHTMNQIQDSLDRLVTALMAISGLNHESMGRELGWHFLNLGRRIERGLLSISLLRSLLVNTLPPAVENILLESILGTIESLVLYRRRHLFQPQLGAVLDVLIFDESNPRSLGFQLRAIRDHIGRLPVRPGRAPQPEERLMIEAWSAVRLAEPADLVTGDPAQGGVRTGLDGLLLRLGELLANTSSTLTDQYFTHVRGPFQLTDTPLELR